jgi:hypothetical protein
MDKVKIEFKLPKSKTVEYNGVEIVVNPFMSLDLQAFLINTYVEDYFVSGDSVVKKDKYDYINAEANLFSNIMQLCTNIDPTCVNNELLSDETLKDLLIANISSYWGFEAKLSRIVDNITNQLESEQSIGMVIDRLVKEGFALLEKFSSTKPEEIEKMTKNTQELLERLEKSSVLNDAVKNTVVKPTSIRKSRKNIVQ